MINSKNQPVSILKKEQAKGFSLKDTGEGKNERGSIIIHSVSQNELELLQADYEKELARKQKLYAQKNFKTKNATQ